MRIYLDNCVFNRPFDDQSADRIRNETSAVLQILSKISTGELDLAWSYVNESENLRNPFEENKRSILGWKQIATIEVLESENLLENSQKVIELGLAVGDALHIASAVEANADFFVTTDDKIIRKIVEFEGGCRYQPD